MFLQCQISLPFSIYKVFTEPNQCLDLHDVYDDKYLLDTAASLNLLFTRYLHVPKRKLYRLFTEKMESLESLESRLDMITFQWI